MVFVFDLDDTLSETDLYSEKYISEFINKNNLPYKQIAKDVRFAERKFDWSTETALKWYKTFGDDMMLEFPLKKGAIEFINFLHENGCKIVIATARATDWHTNPEEITIKWLKDNKIPYDTVYVGRRDKEKICEEVDADYFIDDDVSIVESVANYFLLSKRKKQAFLLTTNYNKNLSISNNVVRVKDFDELKNYFNKNV